MPKRRNSAAASRRRRAPRVLKVRRATIADIRRLPPAPPRPPEDVPSWLPGFIKATAELLPADLEERILRRDAEEAIALEDMKAQLRRERSAGLPVRPPSIPNRRPGRPPGLTDEAFQQHYKEHPGPLSDGARARLLKCSPDAVRRARFRLGVLPTPRNAK